MRDTAENARGRWPGILAALGVDQKYLRNVHGPCPICGGKDRFRFDDQLNGKFICSQCGAGDGFTLLQKLNGWDFKKTADEVERVVGNIPIYRDKKPERTEDDKRAYMKKLWKESAPVSHGDPVWLYLERRCGDPAGVLQDIRFHPALKHSVDGGLHPAMLSMMGWDGARYSGIHRTYLTADGLKADVDPVRMSYGDVGPVRLRTPTGRLGIAEGIETAISAGKLFQIPTWAAISANGLEAFSPPGGTESLTIFGDNDASWTGQSAAYSLAKRLTIAGLVCHVEIPDKQGQDWNEFQQEMQILTAAK